MPPIKAFLYNVRYYLFFGFAFAMLLIVLGGLAGPAQMDLAAILQHPQGGMMALTLAGALVGYLVISRAQESRRHKHLVNGMVGKLTYLRGKFDLEGGWGFSVLVSLLLAVASFVVAASSGLMSKTLIHPFYLLALGVLLLFRAYWSFSGKRSLLVGHSNDSFVYDIDGTVVLPWDKVRSINITRDAIFIDVGGSYDLSIPLYVPFTDEEEDELIRFMQEVQIQSNIRHFDYTDFFLEEGKSKQDELPPSEWTDKKDQKHLRNKNGKSEGEK